MAAIFDILLRRRQCIPWLAAGCGQQLVRQSGWGRSTARQRHWRLVIKGAALGVALWGSASKVKTGDSLSYNWQDEKELVHSIAVAELALKDGNLNKAKEVLEKAIAKAEESQVYVGLSCAYDMLATIAYQQGELAQAQHLLVRVIDRLVSMGVPENDNQVVNFTLKLSRIYDNLGEDRLAEKGFRNCLLTQLQKLKQLEDFDDETGVLWVSILFWYSKFLWEKGRASEAKSYLDTAYEMAAQVSAIEPAQMMVILYNMSGVALVQEDYDSALTHLINAVAIGKSTRNPDLPSYYVMIGIVYLQKGLAKHAKVWCEAGRRKAKSLRNKGAEKEALDCLQKVTLSWHRT